MKKCVVNVACGQWYGRGQDRQREALEKTGFDGDRVYWREAWPPGSPSHQAIPYAFKPYAFKEVRRLGYDLALWMDAAVYPVQHIAYYFDALQRDGHVLLTNRWTTGQWCSDAALKPLKITRDEAMTMPHLMANVVGLDLRNARSNDFLDQWLALADDSVTFPGPWRNDHGEASTDRRVLGHRHDQTAASVVSIRLGMKWLEGPDMRLVYYEGQPLDPSVILLAQGM